MRFAVIGPLKWTAGRKNLSGRFEDTASRCRAG